MLCNNCKYYIYSAVGIPRKFQYHCRFGFKPFVGFLHSFVPPMPYDCRENAHAIAVTLPPKQLELF